MEAVGSDNAALDISWHLLEFWGLGVRQGRSSRPAFSGFDVPATGQGGRPFLRYAPIFRHFCRIPPSLRALFEALAAAKYRSPSRRPARSGRRCARFGAASDAALEEDLADFLTRLPVWPGPGPS